MIFILITHGFGGIRSEEDVRPGPAWRRDASLYKSDRESGGHEDPRPQREPPADRQHQQHPERHAGRFREGGRGARDRPPLRVPVRQLQRLPHLRDPRGRQMHGRGRRLQRPSQQDARRRRDTPGRSHVFRGVPQRHADLPGEGGARPREERPGPPRKGGRRRCRLFPSGRVARLQPDGGLPAEQRDARGRG